MYLFCLYYKDTRRIESILRSMASTMNQCTTNLNNELERKQVLIAGRDMARNRTVVVENAEETKGNSSEGKKKQNNFSLFHFFHFYFMFSLFHFITLSLFHLYLMFLILLWFVGEMVRMMETEDTIQFENIAGVLKTSFGELHLHFKNNLTKN